MFEDHPMQGIAAVRGAVTAAANTPSDILDATRRLILALVQRNRLTPERIVSAIFTVTADLDAEFPAHAARKLGWGDVPLLCAREIDVPGSLPRVIRVLLTVSEVAPGTRLVPAYLDGAAALRPDLPGGEAPSRSASGDERPVATIAIIGLGQIGGSIGLALGAVSGWKRVGFDVDRTTLERAHAREVIDERADSIEQACAGADLAVIAVPVDVLPATIDAAAAALSGGAALIDTGSARHGVTEALTRATSRGLRVVGGHPIAGSEGHGLEAARSDLFQGTSFALCPIDDQGTPAVVKRMIEDLGATPLACDADHHDEALARTSHLPYLIARAVRSLGEAAAGEGLAGPAFRDLTRVAASDARVALAYCRANGEHVRQAWKELRARLDAEIAKLPGAR